MFTILMDTSNSKLVVGIANETKVLVSKQINALKQQSELAIPVLNELMQSQNISMQDVQTMVITAGPGSYTGLRIAMTIAKTLASVLDIKIKAISTLAMQAYGKKAISVVDARSKKAYVGMYDHGKVIMEDCLMLVEDLKELVSNHFDYEVVGDCELVGLEKEEFDLATALFEISKEVEPVEFVDGLVPHYIKDVEVQKKC